MLQISTANLATYTETVDLDNYITDQYLDVCCLMETWLREDDNITPYNHCPEAYDIYSVPRRGRTGDSVAVINRNTLRLKRIETIPFSSFELSLMEQVHPKYSNPLLLAIAFLG